MLVLLSAVFFCYTAAATVDPCQNIQCGDNYECYLGKCFGAWPSSGCREQCSQNQQCIFGECTNILSNVASTCNPSCKDNEECSSGQCYPTFNTPCNNACPASYQCLLGSCVQNNNVCSQCSQGQWCGAGNICINFSPQASCPTPCRSNELCVYGTCVPPAAMANYTSPCAGGCPRNQMCVNISSGQDSRWECVLANGACNNCAPSDNQTSPVCSYGACQQCAICENINDMFVMNLMHLNLIQNVTSVQLIESNATNNAPLGAGTFATTQSLKAPSGYSMRWQSLFFGTDVSSGAAVFGVSPGATIEVQNQTHSLATSAIIIGKSSVLQNNKWKISENADVIVAFDSAQIDLEVARMITVELQLNGRLIIVGEGSLTLPQDSTKFVASSSSSIIVSGSAMLNGDATSKPIVVSPFGPYAAEMRVSPNSELHSANLLGSQGRILVLGSLISYGLVIQPTVFIGNGGRLSLRGPAVKAGNLILSAGGQLEVNSPGSLTYFSEIQTCADGATISFKLNDTLESLFEHCNDREICTGVILRYDPITVRNVGKFACSIKLQDAVGARMTLVLHNTSKPIMNGISGAILNQAVFNATSLSFYVQNAQADIPPHSGGLSTFSKSMLGFGIMGAFFISCVAAVVCYRKKKKKREEKYLLESDDEPLPRAALNYDNYSSMASASSHSEA